jgi:glucose-1-phosphate cytidylyltransferase
MKVVLFCGGYGMRMRHDGSDDVPKPMAMIGDRPLLWHVMRYYAHFGHKEFILCLGYGQWAVKSFFLNYQETRTNDFVLRGDGGNVEMLANDIADWTITFVDTGLETAIGERLRRVRKYLDGDDVFLANYADVLTDAPLDDVVRRLTSSDAAASLLAVAPQSSFHVVECDDDDDRVSDIHSVATFNLRENGGYFVLRQDIFEALEEGEDLVGHGLRRLAKQRKLLAYEYDGFWMPADTVKERAELEAMYKDGRRPWALWEHERGATGAPAG